MDGLQESDLALAGEDEQKKFEQNDLEVLVTTRISLDPSTRNLNEMQLQALRDRLEMETKSFLNQVSTYDGVSRDACDGGASRKDFTSQLLTDGMDKQEVALKPDTVSSEEETQASQVYVRQEQEMELGQEDDRQQMVISMCESTTSFSGDEQESQCVCSEEENEHFVSVLRRREELLRLKRAAIKSLPPALWKSPSCQGSRLSDMKPQGPDAERKELGQVITEGQTQTPYSTSAADVIVESLRQVALLKPELEDIDRLSLGMKASASRILAEFSVPLPLNETSVMKKERRIVSRKGKSPVPSTQPFQPCSPPPYTLSTMKQNSPTYLSSYASFYSPNSVQYFPFRVPVRLPMVSQYCRPSELMMVQGGISMNYPPPLVMSSLQSQQPISSVAVSNLGNGTSPACSSNSTSSLMSSHSGSQLVSTPEHYFNQIAATVPPIGSKTPATYNYDSSQFIRQSFSESQEKDQLEMETEMEKRQKEQLRLLIQESQENNEFSTQSSNSPGDNVPVTSSVTSAGKAITECNSVDVQSLMTTSEQHSINIRCFMSRLPAEYRRKPERVNDATDNTKCDICGKVMARKGLLVHRRIHFGDKRFKCDICGRSFTQACNMRTHLKVHFKVKEHKCSDCGKVFSRAQHLYEHKRIHTGERPYVCRFCGCSFKAYSTLYSHIGTHTGHKHECQVCRRTFAKACNLETHIRSKHANESQTLTVVAVPRGGSESSSRGSLSPN
ncbi:uncharacterized protein LOC134177187 [Corticium candelabrum]|uniref:uncharacterized protein LOC134177187 n=1 Tax=Corticium candelabrum TaxID=121492 RepID=UPI002E25818B|nr:uncharacterized protein LOC134177187 [Corticium candelabrum]